MLCMGFKMSSIAILCLLLLERFLISDMDEITEPVLNGLRILEKSALKYTRNIIPPDFLTRMHSKLAKFYLFVPELISDGIRLDIESMQGFEYFSPYLETKMIIHGFLDKVKIAEWMHDMKNEFLFLDDFNIIIVDWSSGNFLPYTTAAANTEKVGEEIADLLKLLQVNCGARIETFHLIGHSLGSHVAGYAGERIKGIKRITGLDPATYLFKNVSPNKKLDLNDAKFVDVIHTDGGGIGMEEPVGHLDFYPNGGTVQTGCTASNSVRSLLEKGVVEGVRNIICSHMRAPLLFTDTINSRHCQMLAYNCSSWEAYSRGECFSCGDSGENCAPMGYHIDLNRNYGNGSKYYLLTSNTSPFCGFEYKITLKGVNDSDDNQRQRMFTSNVRRREWTTSDILHISLYGSIGTAEFKIETKRDGWQNNHIVYSPRFIGDVIGIIIRWSRKPITRTRGMMNVISSVLGREVKPPIILRIQVSPLKTPQDWQSDFGLYDLCVSPVFSGEQNQQGATFRREYC